MWGNKSQRGRATLLRSGRQLTELGFEPRLPALMACGLSHYIILSRVSLSEGGEGDSGSLKGDLAPFKNEVLIAASVNVQLF